MEKSQDSPILPINRAEALDRIGGDPGFLDELLEIYGQEFQMRAKELHVAMKKQDFQAIFELGHSLKGSSANLSLPGLQQAALDIETSGRAKDLRKAEDALARLEREFDRLEDFLARSDT